MISKCLNENCFIQLSGKRNYSYDYYIVNKKLKSVHRTISYLLGPRNENNIEMRVSYY